MNSAGYGVATWNELPGYANYNYNEIGRIVGRITLTAISASSAVVTGMRHIGGFGGWINLAVITATSMLVTRNNAIDWPGDG